MNTTMGGRTAAHMCGSCGGGGKRDFGRIVPKAGVFARFANILRGPVYFFRPDDGTEFACLSNYSDHPLALPYDDRIIEFRSVEHYYQAMKFRDTDIEWGHAIIATDSPNRVTAMGRSRWHTQDPHWHETRLSVMETAINAKFVMCRDVREALRGTRPRKILCLAKHDEYWGTGEMGRGANWLGRLWESARDAEGFR